MTEKIVIPYFNIYASDFKAFKDKLTSDEFMQVIDAISDICLFGDSDFETENKFQMMFFLKLKESLLKNIPKYKSCIENGKKGGRPKKNETEEKPMGFLNNNPIKTQTKPIKEKKRKDNIIEDNISKIDPYNNSHKEFFKKTYQDIMGNKAYLSNQDLTKILNLVECYSDFKEILPLAIEKLKQINFKDINFKPSASWLLKDNNFERVMNGEFDKKEDKEVNGWTLV